MRGRFFCSELQTYDYRPGELQTYDYRPGAVRSAVVGYGLFQRNSGGALNDWIVDANAMTKKIMCKLARSQQLTRRRPPAGSRKLPLIRH
jgi:hypothetical protein